MKNLLPPGGASTKTKSITSSSKSSLLPARDLKLLERVFTGEIEAAMKGHALPVQIKSKRMLVLESEGYVEEVTVTLPGRFPVRVTGWVLTVRGNYAYCSSCK